MNDCIRDDSTECDCPRCVGADEQWERDQGWHDDGGYDDGGLDDSYDRGCVLGSECLAVDPYHRADECFDLEMAESFMRAESVRSKVRTGRQRTRALWRRRGRR